MLFNWNYLDFYSDFSENGRHSLLELVRACIEGREIEEQRRDNEIEMKLFLPLNKNPL